MDETFVLRQRFITEEKPKDLIKEWLAIKFY